MATVESAPKRMDPSEFQKMLDMQCPYHKNHKHLDRDCFGLKNHFSGKGRSKGPSKNDKGKGKRAPPTDDDEEDFQVADRTINMIYGGPDQVEGKHKAKLTDRLLVYAAQHGMPQFLWWSEVPIIFSREDHPEVVVKPGPLQ